MNGPFGQRESGGPGPFGESQQSLAQSGPFATSQSSSSGPFGSASMPATGAPTIGSSSSGGSTSSAPIAFTSGPQGLLFVALVGAVVGLGLAVVLLMGVLPATSMRYFIVAVVAWVLCGIVTFIVLGVYTIRDNVLRANSVYVAQDVQALLYRVSLGLGGVGVIVTACEIALWASKL